MELNTWFESPDSWSVESTALCAVFATVLALASLSNGLLLYIFRKTSSLRTVSNRFVINLLVTNLALNWSIVPLMLFDMIKGIGRDPEDTTTPYAVLCSVDEGVSMAGCVATVLSVLLVAVDQFYAIMDPLRYHSYINASSSGWMIAASWAVSVVFGVLGGVSSDQMSPWYVCHQVDEPILPTAYRNAFTLLFACAIFVAPFASICRIYYRIYWAAQGNVRRARRNGSVTNFGLPVAEAVIEEGKTMTRSPTKTSLIRSASSSVLSTLKHRISNASVFKYREETRAARISASVVVMALFCWLPFTLIPIITSPLIQIKLPNYAHRLGLLCLVSNGILSPLIFAHRNRRIRREISKLFRSKKGARSSFYSDIKMPGAKKTSALRTDGTWLVVERKTRRPDTTSALVCVRNVVTKMWMNGGAAGSCPPISAESEALQKLPEAATDVDTSRSSFSSNCSGYSTNQASTSGASIDDITEEEDNVVEYA